MDRNDLQEIKKMIFYVSYQNEILEYNILCAALSFIKLVGGELFFKKPNIKTQLELFNK